MGVGDEALEISRRQVLEHLDNWGPVTLPERPEALSFDDGQLVEAYRQVERGNKVGKDGKLQLQLFGAWRTAVWHGEQQRQGSLIVLARLVRDYESKVIKAKKQKQASAELAGEAHRVRDFIREKYKKPLPSFVPVGIEIYRWAAWVAADFELLPRWLRKMEKPPSGQGTRPNPEDDAGHPLFDHYTEND